MNKLSATDQRLKKLFKDTNFESYQYEGFDSAEKLIEHIQTEISDDEVIYYSNAIKYLSEHDASLSDSMALADELGYEIKNINSELLATLLMQQNLNKELGRLTSEIETIYEEADNN